MKMNAMRTRKPIDNIVYTEVWSMSCHSWQKVLLNRIRHTDRLLILESMSVLRASLVLALVFSSVYLRLLVNKSLMRYAKNVPLL